MEHIMYCNAKKNEYNNIVYNNQRIIIKSAQNRRIPHSRIFKGETIYFTQKNTNEVTYCAEVKEVYNYTKLPDSEIRRVLKIKHKSLNLTDKDLQQYYKKCICIIEIENLKEIDKILIKPQAPMVDWIILQNIKDIEV